MPLASIVVPAFNVATTLAQTLNALALQTASDFEIIVVDDGSTDASLIIANSFKARSNIRIISQANRGLAGARNTGVAAAKGQFIGFCDADDIWERRKLQTHIDHLQANPDVGISYSGSILMDDDGASLGLAQTPKLQNISPADILKRNPIGNGSAAVFRRQALRDIAYRPAFETQRDWVFDETFRQSEDIECWLRMVLSTDWQFEGVPALLTRYRVNASGLSAALDRQLASWERAIDKLRPLNPAFFAAHEATARAYQLRYLARRAISNQQRHAARNLMRQAFENAWCPLFEEPVKTLTTLLACHLPTTVSSSLMATRRRLKNRTLSV